MTFKPEPGLVIRYDFLWHEDQTQGQIHGRKDRPSAIIVVSETDESGNSDVYLCPITHSPCRNDETGFEIPLKLAKYLNLDDQRSWVKTHQINVLSWQKDVIPYGVSRANKDSWVFGMMPQRFTEQIIQQVKNNFSRKRLKTSKR